MDGSDAAKPAQAEPDEEGAPDEVLLGHEAPKTAVRGVVAVVAHGEVAVRWHDAIEGPAGAV